jgi:hypothetical protein
MLKVVWWVLGISIFLGGVSAGAVAIHENAVKDRRQDIVERSNENRLWLMLADDETIDNSDVGQVARLVKPAVDNRNMLLALTHVYIQPDTFDNVNKILHTDLVSADDAYQNNGGGLSDRFIIRAAQAKDNPKAFALKVPEPRDQGYFVWRNVAVLPLLAWLMLPILLLIRAIYRWHDLRRRVRDRQRYLKSLSPQAREILRIKEALNQMPYSTEVSKAKRSADQAFTLATKGWLDTEQRAMLKSLSADIGAINESVVEGQKTYEENA